MDRFNFWLLGVLMGGGGMMALVYFRDHKQDIPTSDFLDGFQAGLKQAARLVEANDRKLTYDYGDAADLAGDIRSLVFSQQFK